MAVKLEQVLARVTASQRMTSQADHDRLRSIVLETIAAVGLEVDHRQGEVYDPAGRQTVRPRDDRNFRFIGGGRRR